MPVTPRKEVGKVVLKSPRGRPSPGNSPGWTNPRQVLKRFHDRRPAKKRKLELPVAPAEDHSAVKEPDVPNLSSASPTKRKKKLNPFRLSPRKRVRARGQCKARAEEARRPIMSLYSPAALEDDSNSRLLGGLDAHDDAFDNGDKLSALPTDFSCLKKELGGFAQSSSPKEALVLPAKQNVPTPVQKKCEESRVPPVDLRPGTRLRILSATPFPWMPETSEEVFPLRSTGKAQGVLQATKGRALGGVTNWNVEEHTSELLSEIYAASLLCQFPSVPWVESFPRLSADLRDLRRLSQSRDENKESNLLAMGALGKKLSEKLTAEWKTSFEQVYHQWKAGDCPYFYLCCPQFTVVFVRGHSGGILSPQPLSPANTTTRSSQSFRSVAGATAFKVFITPTTKGFRKILREDEDIAYEQPLLAKSRRGSKDSYTTCGRDSLDSQASFEGDVGRTPDLAVTQSQPGFLMRDMREESMERLKVASSAGNEDRDSETDGELNSSGDLTDMLKDCGISPDKQRQLLERSSSLVAGSVRKGRRGELGLEEQRQSLVLVQGFPAVQSLFNFFLNNSKTYLSSISGSHPGLPPTILAPTFFYGGTLVAPKGKGSFNKGAASPYCLEFEGPIMPHFTFRLEQLLQKYRDRFPSWNLNFRPVSCPGLNCAARNVLSESSEDVLEAEDVTFEDALLRNLADLPDVRFLDGVVSWRVPP